MHQPLKVEVDTQYPRALLFCYHYHPSNAVAARRIRAMAQVLASTGLLVQVVSAFAGAPIACGEDLGSGIVAHPVIEPASFLLSRLVGIKRLFTGRAQTPSTQLAPRPPPTDPAMDSNAQRSGRRIRDGFFALLNIVDPHKKWAIRAAFSALRSARNRDVRVVVASGPPFSGVMAAWFVARRLRVPLITDFRDPLLTGGDGVIRITRPARIVLRRLERGMMKYATAVTSASPGIASALRRKYPPRVPHIHLMMNGYDGEPVAGSVHTGHRLSMLFAGILYINRNPFPFLQAMEAFLARPEVDPQRISMRFVGSCEEFGGVPLAEWLRGKRAAQVVELLPQCAAKELQPLIQDATVLLNFAQGQRQLIPAKTFEHLASGREVLALCEPDSDTGRLLATVRGVAQVAPGDQAAIEAALSSLYQRHVVQGLLTIPSPEDVRRFSRASQNDIFSHVVKSVTGRVEARICEFST